MDSKMSPRGVRVEERIEGARKSLSHDGSRRQLLQELLEAEFRSLLKELPEGVAIMGEGSLLPGKRGGREWLLLPRAGWALWPDRGFKGSPDQGRRLQAEQGDRGLPGAGYLCQGPLSCSGDEREVPAAHASGLFTGKGGTTGIRREKYGQAEVTPRCYAL